MKIKLKNPWKVINTKGPKMVYAVKFLNAVMNYSDIIWNISHITIAQIGSIRVAFRSYTYTQKDCYL